MKKLAVVVALRPVDEASIRDTPPRSDDVVDYWEQVQALRAELADLAGTA